MNASAIEALANNEAKRPSTIHRGQDSPSHRGSARDATSGNKDRAVKDKPVTEEAGGTSRTIRVAQAKRRRTESQVRGKWRTKDDVTGLREYAIGMQW
jgi:hypothetical protein